MNNKAFTLIELTAVIVVLSAIFLVSFPNLLNMTKSDENKKYDNMVKNLCMAGESYIYENTSSYEGLSIVGTEIRISISDLIIYGSVDSNLTNPNTKKSVKNSMLIYTVLSDNSLDCVYDES